MTWPPDITKIPEVLANIFRDTFDRIDANRPIDGLGVKCEDGSGGRIINAQGGGPGGASPGLHPLLLLGIDETHIRIVYGTVAGFSDPFSPGDVPIYSLEVADGDKVWAGVSTAYDSLSGAWTDSALFFISQPDDPNPDPTAAYIELGSVGDDGVVASATSGSIGHTRCGDETIFGDKWYLV